MAQSQITRYCITVSFLGTFVGSDPEDTWLIKVVHLPPKTAETGEGQRQLVQLKEKLSLALAQPIISSYSMAIEHGQSMVSFPIKHGDFPYS